jgi:hypothetical protein
MFVPANVADNHVVRISLRHSEFIHFPSLLLHTLVTEAKAGSSSTTLAGGGRKAEDLEARTKTAVVGAANDNVAAMP